MSVGIYFQSIDGDEEAILRESGSIYHRKKKRRWYKFVADSDVVFVIDGSSAKKSTRPHSPPNLSTMRWMEMEMPYVVEGIAEEGKSQQKGDSG
jgi:hypothetical protein